MYENRTILNLVPWSSHTMTESGALNGSLIQFKTLHLCQNVASTLWISCALLMQVFYSKEKTMMNKMEYFHFCEAHWCWIICSHMKLLGLRSSSSLDQGYTLLYCNVPLKESPIGYTGIGTDFDPHWLIPWFSLFVKRYGNKILMLIISKWEWTFIVICSADR